MPDHKRACRSLLLRERQKLRRELTNSVTVERYKICHPEAVEDGEQ